MVLVLTRRRGDCIVLGSGPSRVVIVTIDARGGAATLSIEAPAGLPVVRGELVDEPRRHVPPRAPRRGRDTRRR